MNDISYYLDQPYTRVLKRDDEGDIIATISELDGCIAHGSNEFEALQNLREAQAAWLEHAIAAGQDIPVPELDEDLPSGKFVVRLPRSLHQKLNKIAKKEDVSLNQLMQLAVTEHVARREGRHELMLRDWRPKPVKWNTTGTGESVTGEFMERIKEHGVVTVGEDDKHPHQRSGPSRRKG